MKIENGLLFFSAFTFETAPEINAITASSVCVPIHNISHLEELPHAGKVYTVLHLKSGDDVIACASIPDLIQIITEANAMNLFGYVHTNYFTNVDTVIKGSDLKVMLERNAKRNDAPISLAKGGVIEPSHEDYGIH